MVEARSGFFRAGLDAVFGVLETGRDMLKLPRRGGALQRHAPTVADGGEAPGRPGERVGTGSAISLVKL
jgi:hypothetical protein